MTNTKNAAVATDTHAPAVPVTTVPYVGGPPSVLPMTAAHNPTVRINPSKWECYSAEGAGWTRLEAILWTESVLAEARPAAKDGRRFLANLILEGGL